jgi:ABC-2 type transport system ATP-binding protein
MIEIRNAAFQYNHKQKALDKINWSVGYGMTGLLGPNGAGKTTLLRLLATLARPASGEIRIAGISVSRPEEVREQIGYLPQHFELPERMTVRVFLDYAAAMRGLRTPQSRRQETDRLLVELNLEEAADKRISALSSGMKQRTGLAQAMAGSPPVLIVDEPTVGLDPEERLRLRNLLARYCTSGGRTVLLSTHLIPDVEMSCRRLGVLKDGRLVKSGTPEELASAASGLVWSMELTDREFAGLCYSRLVRATRTEEGIACRVLSERCPAPGAVSVEPSLEDGYMALVGEGTLP